MKHPRLISATLLGVCLMLCTSKLQAKDEDGSVEGMLGNGRTEISPTSTVEKAKPKVASTQTHPRESVVDENSPLLKVLERLKTRGLGEREVFDPVWRKQRIEELKSIRRSNIDGARNVYRELRVDLLQYEDDLKKEIRHLQIQRSLIKPETDGAVKKLKEISDRLEELRRSSFASSHDRALIKNILTLKDPQQRLEAMRGFQLIRLGEMEIKEILQYENGLIDLNRLEEISKRPLVAKAAYARQNGESIYKTHRLPLGIGLEAQGSQSFPKDGISHGDWEEFYDQHRELGRDPNKTKENLAQLQSYLESKSRGKDSEAETPESRFEERRQLERNLDRLQFSINQHRTQLIPISENKYNRLKKELADARDLFRSYQNRARKELRAVLAEGSRGTRKYQQLQTEVQNRKQLVAKLSRETELARKEYSEYVNSLEIKLSQLNQAQEYLRRRSTEGKVSLPRYFVPRPAVVHESLRDHTPLTRLLPRQMTGSEFMARIVEENEKPAEQPPGEEGAILRGISRVQQGFSRVAHDCKSILLHVRPQ